MPDPYIPNDKQIEAHCATEQFIGYGGAMGGGKTRFICEMAKKLSVQFPNNLGVIARQSGPALKLSTMEVFFSETLIEGSQEWKDLGCKFHKADGVLTFEALNPPSKIWFTGLDNNNLERIKSLNLGFFCIDEATEVAEAVFLMLVTRLRRVGIPEEYRKAIISANPEAGWIKRRFIDQKLSNHVFVQATPKDNPHLPKNYASLFDHMPEHWKKRYLEGDWGSVTGLIYKDFIYDRHVIPTIPIPYGWKKFRALDHGQQNPCACMGFCYGYPSIDELEEYVGKEAVSQVNPDFDNYPIIFVYRLYYSSGLVQDHKIAIKHTFMDIENPGLVHADPSIWQKDRAKVLADGTRTEFSIADEYEERPDELKGLTRANNQVAAGINRVATLFRIGHLYIMDCDSLDPLIGDAGEILSYAWKNAKVDGDDWPEEPVKNRDHAVDALRYGVMSLPPLQPKKTNVIPFNSFVAARKRAIEFKYGARTTYIDRKGKLRIVKNAKSI